MDNLAYVIITLAAIAILLQVTLNRRNIVRGARRIRGWFPL